MKEEGVSAPEATEPKEATAASRLKGWAITAVKLILAVGLLAWLFSRGDLDPQTLARPFETPALVALVLFLGALGLSITALRWWILLKAEGIHVPVLKAVQLTWIGHFWNMVIPGAVSGDAVKMYYVGRHVPAEQREESWSTVFADRVIGLGALVTLATCVALTELDLMLSRAELQATLAGMVLVLVGFLGSGLVVTLGIGSTWRVVAALRARLPFGESLARALSALQRLGRRPGKLALAFVISLFTHFMNVGNAWLVGSTFSKLGPSLYFVLVPVGMFSNAIPLTPGGGIGVGEAVLGNLFAWAAPAGFAPAELSRTGVSVMVWMRVIFYVMAGTGGIIYAFHGKVEPVQAASGTAQEAGADGSAGDPP